MGYYYDNLSEEQIKEKIENIRNTESFIDLIIEQNDMIAKGEINNPVFKALQKEIEKREQERQEELGGRKK